MSFILLLENSIFFYANRYYYGMHVGPLLSEDLVHYKLYWRGLWCFGKYKIMRKEPVLLERTLVFCGFCAGISGL